MKNTINRTIQGKDIKRIRIKLGLTQAEFANLVNVSKRAVEKWETKEE